MSVQIQAATLEDANAFAVLFNTVEAYHRQHMPSRYRQPPENYAIEFFQQALTSENSKIFFAVSDADIVGYILVNIKEIGSSPMLNPGKFFFVEQLAISPAARRRNIGTELMNFAEQLAKKMGFNEVELNYWMFNDVAEKFYRTLGYEPRRVIVTKTL